MLHISTRGEAPSLSFADALLAGLARDGGLYLPQALPRFSAQEIAGFAGKPFHEVAFSIISRFTGTDIPDADLREMTRAAYASFRHPSTAPVVG